MQQLSILQIYSYQQFSLHSNDYSSQTELGFYLNMTVILVTGGNRGIGLGIVEVTAKRLPSPTIIIGCRSLRSGEEAIQQLRHRGVTARLETVQIDIEDDDSILSAVQSVEERFHKLDGKNESSSSICLGRC
jgi:hypothetical protein